MSLKSNLLPFVHWPADRHLALPGPFHVIAMQQLKVLLFSSAYTIFIQTSGDATQVFPVILTQGQNKKKCPNKSWAVFKYLWVGKV